MALKKAQEREFARVLFLYENLSQKEIAERVGVQEKTLKDWIDRDGWRKLKQSLQTTREKNLKQFYEQMEWLNEQIATRAWVYDIPKDLLKPVKEKSADGAITVSWPEYNPKDFPLLIGNVATAKEADVLIKLSTAIKNLEVETGLGETYEVGRDFIEFVRQQDLALAKTITAWFDLFIQSKSSK
jgi:transcriptional regulator with XRE-family HTH domain